MTDTIRVTQTVDLTPQAREALAAYKAVRDPAWAAYEAVRDPALAAYEAVNDQALAAYEAVRDPALAAYEAVRDQAWAAYEAVRDQALAAYEAVNDPALAALAEVHPTLAEAARTYLTELTEVIGMLPCTLGALDAHADNNDWCSAWTRLRDDAISEGLLVVVETPAAVTE